MINELKLEGSKLNGLLLYILIVCSLISYYPIVAPLKFIQYIIFFAIIVINIKYIIYNSANNYIYCFLWILALLSYYGILIIVNKYIYYSDIYAIVISFLMLITFSSIKLCNIKKDKILRYGCISIIIITVFIIYDIKGDLKLDFNENGYFYGSKNGLAPILELAGIYLLYNYLFKSSKSKLDIIVYLISFWLIGIMQTRTAILSFVIGSIFILMYKILESKLSLLKLMKFTVIIIMIIFILLYTADDIIIFTLKLLRIDNDSSISSISSGRSNTIIDSITLFTSNPIFGISYNVNKIREFGLIHNLWIKALFYGGISYFIIFIGYVLFLLNNILKNNINDKILVYCLILIAFINSNLEVISPFGPGTSYMLFWMIIGLNMKISKV